MKRKTCPYCQCSFIPNPKVGPRQKTCGNPACKKALKIENNLRWRQENPDCCHPDYPRVKEWLDQHPGYLQRFRQSHPQYVQKNRQAQRLRDRRKKLHLDIQAQIKDQLPEITEQLWNLPRLDIQDEISLKPLEMTFLFSAFPCLDIQVQFDKPIGLKENGIILNRG
jgi:hypothetical protein